jgi:predicted nucleic acid-binding protein
MIMCYVLDTNVALYLLGGRLVNPLPIGAFYISVISEMEMLSYSAIADDEMVRVQEFLSKVTIVGLSENIKNEAIVLRKKYRLKLPDAIVCATTLVVKARLLSNDAQLGRVPEINVDTVQIQ